MCHILFMLAISQLIIYNQVSMSIPNLLHKIKSKIDIDINTLIYLSVIIGVGIGAFGLGRLSVSETILPNNSTNIGSNSLYKASLVPNMINNTIDDKEPLNTGEKRYVASKNGKMYYSLGCSGAKRINKENEVWFSSQLEAEQSGFKLASSCK